VLVAGNQDDNSEKQMAQVLASISTSLLHTKPIAVTDALHTITLN